MERHDPALSFVGNLDFQAKDVAELTLKRLYVCVRCLGRISGAGSPDVRTRGPRIFLAARLLFGLANREASSDDIAG